MIDGLRMLQCWTYSGELMLTGGAQIRKLSHVQDPTTSRGECYSHPLPYSSIDECKSNVHGYTPATNHKIDDHIIRISKSQGDTSPCHENASDPSLQRCSHCSEQGARSNSFDSRTAYLDQHSTYNHHIIRQRKCSFISISTTGQRCLSRAYTCRAASTTTSTNAHNTTR